MSRYSFRCTQLLKLRKCCITGGGKKRTVYFPGSVKTLSGEVLESECKVNGIRVTNKKPACQHFANY